MDSIEETEFLAPTWKREYTQPLRDKIEELTD